MSAILFLMTLAACQQSRHDASAPKEEVCRMPGNGKPEAAVRAALLRGDYRLMMYTPNGESPHHWPLGVEYAGRAKWDPLWNSYQIDSHQCGYELPISEGETPACCDQPAPLTPCGEKQYAYAVAYNREMIGSSQFKKACGSYKPDRYGDTDRR